MSLTASTFLTSNTDRVVPVPTAPFPLNAPVAPSRRGSNEGDIGIEFEFEGTLRSRAFPVSKTTGATWILKEDGSLRGGHEYVLSVPCAVDELPELVEGLYESFNTSSSAFSLSNRCSTHVHINVKGLKANNLTAIIALWMTFEESIIEYMGEVRKANHFCLSTKDASSLQTFWSSFLDNGFVPEGGGYKYSALNLLPIWRFGSIEFRCAPAWDTSDKPIEWAKFLLALRDYAVENYENPQDLAIAISEQTPLGIFTEICRKADVNNFRTNVLEATGSSEDTFNNNGIRGLREAQPFLFNHPWVDWLPDLRREYIHNPFR